jgi:hypothetical protein
VTVTHRRRRTLTAAAVGMVAVLTLTVPADAQWTSAATGGGQARVSQLPTGPTPSATASGTSVTVAWTPVTLGAGLVGYRLGRVDATTGVAATMTSCTTVLLGLACTETGVPAGIWRYRVTPVLANWSGPAGAPSPAVTIVSAPELTSLQALDADVNGRLDTVVATFDQAPPAAAATVGNWVLTAPPTGASPASVTVAGTTATLTLDEGAVSTAVGGLQVALTGSFAATTPTDGAHPLPTAVTTIATGTTPGRFEPGDRLAVTLSEPLGVHGTPAPVTTVTLVDPPGNTNGTLTVPGLLSGTVDLGTAGYLNQNNRTAAWAASTFALSADRTTVTLTLGPACAGNGCGNLATVTSTPTVPVTLAAALVDPAGNAPITTAKPFAIRLF